jgi:V/A-type H+-transporting ATPase subunit K
MKPVPKLVAALVVLAAVSAVVATALVVVAPAALAASGAAPGAGLPADAWSFGLLGAALATGLSSLGAGYAVAKVGTAAVGALAEKPELFARLLIFVGLAEGIAIYGLIVSILILNRLAA